MNLDKETITVIDAKKIDLDTIDELRVISDADGPDNIFISYETMKCSNTSDILELAKNVKSGLLWIQNCDSERYYENALKP
jgi:hypothetical protein